MQALRSGLEIDPTDGAQRHPAPRFEAVEQSVAPPIGTELLLEGPEQLRRHRLQLEAHLVAGPTAAFHPVTPLPAEAVGEEPALLGQRRRRRRRHLREHEAILAPANDMAGAGDRDAGRVAAPFDRARGMDLEQLRMQNAPVELKDEVGDFGTGRQHAGDSPLNGS